jgi:SAM-dependent methyltransferase
MSRHRDQLEHWLSTLSVTGGSLLDVGGSEKPVQGRLGTCTPQRTAILDTAAGADYVFDLNQFQAPQELFAFEASPYWDCIFCLEVFEYLWNPVIALQNLYHWLSPQGTLYLSLTWQYPLHAPEGLDCLRYSDAWVRQAVGRLFRTVDIIPRRMQSAELLAAQWRQEGMHPLRGGDHTPSGFLITAQK